MDQFRSLITRAEVIAGGSLRGYAAVFDQPTWRQRDFAGSETIARGAFADVVGGDVLALVNHDMGQVLGRTSAGTLRLSEDDHGLAFEVDLPDTTLGRDVRELVARGDLAGMSFTAQVGQVERTEGGVIHRSFKRLVDVSVVTMPAYAGTSVMSRNTPPAISLREQLVRARARVAKRGNSNDR
jgi:HK97 family phage prohead protease